jgi:hypothetical protein
LLFNVLVLTFTAIAEVQVVLNAANAGAVCLPALPSHMNVVNVVVQEHNPPTTYIHVGIPKGEGTALPLAVAAC